MLHRPPPLNAVRAFVAAARHLSFTRAGQELGVTHGAVSRQVRQLEDYLGVELFERRTRQIVLTAAGAQFLADTAPALASISAAAEVFVGRSAPRAVRINVRPSFAVRWLIPRLPDFVARHPQVKPEVVTSTLAPEKALESFDVAIRRGRRGWPPSIEARAFMQDEGLVVAAPELLRARPIGRPADLAGHVLLYSRSRRADWEAWFTQVGRPRARQQQTLQFDHLHFVMQAALDGLGLALAPVSLLGHDLARGRLAAPLPDLRLALDRYYYGIAPDAGPAAQSFVAWLQDVAQAEQRQLLKRAGIAAS
ncbi:MAG: LysR substrate-binding domain-containing protein [Pigmentiphaga sp.]|uniref:LysR substrate-binding domain-containing protein n=1 Tax=Pigmentiphaga sp. TaxID=1977564 RepID=UPI003B5446B4